MNRILIATAMVAMAALTAAPALAATTSTMAAKPAVKTAKVVAKTAAATPAKPAVVTFKSLDTNHDGRISFAEIHKVWPRVTKAEFAKYDANKDGFYNHAELAAFAKAIQPAKVSAKPAK